MSLTECSHLRNFICYCLSRLPHIVCHFFKKKREVRAHSVADNVHDAVAPCVIATIWKQCRVFEQSRSNEDQACVRRQTVSKDSWKELKRFDEDVEVIVRSGQAPVRLAIVFV